MRFILFTEIGAENIIMSVLKHEFEGTTFGRICKIFTDYVPIEGFTNNDELIKAMLTKQLHMKGLHKVYIEM